MEAVVALREKILGAEDNQTIRSRKNLDLLMKALTDPPDENPFHSIARGKWVDIAYGIMSKAQKLDREGKTPEAIVEAVRALGIWRKVSAPDAENVIMTLEILAALYEKGHDYAASRPYRQEALALHIKKLGPHHWKVTDARLALALTERLSALSDRERGQIEQAGKWLRQVGVLDQKGKYEDALPLAQQTADTYGRILGEHQWTARSLSWIGSLLSRAGRDMEAKKMYQQLLSMQRRIFGTHHPKTAATLNLFGILMQKLEDYDSARQYFEEALTIRKNLFGAEAAETAHIMNNLGNLLLETGDYGSAQAYFEQALTVREKVLGPEHSDTANTLHGIAVLMQKKGDYGSAQKYYERTLFVWKKALGHDHPWVAFCITNLGSLMESAGKPEDARKYFEEALALRKKIHGTDHRETAAGFRNLADLFQRMGRYAKAEEYYHRAMDIYERVLGKQHPQYTRSAASLAVMWDTQANQKEEKGDYEAAIIIRNRIFKQKIERFGTDHWEVKDAREKINHLKRLARLTPNQQQRLEKTQKLFDAAKPLWDQKKYRDIIPLAREVLDIFMDLFGPDDRETFGSMVYLAAVYLNAGMKDRAESLYLKANRSIERVLGPSHPEYAAILSIQASMYEKTGDLARAEQYYRRLLDIRKSSLGVWHGDYKNSLASLARVYDGMAAHHQEKGDFEKAKQFNAKAMEMKTRLYGRHHWQVLDMRLKRDHMTRLAEMDPGERQRLKEAETFIRSAKTFQQADAFARAADSARRALRIQQDILGLADPHTIKTLKLLGDLSWAQDADRDAEIYYDKALVTAQKVYGQDHPTTADILNTLGLVTRRLGQYEKARAYLQQALTINQKLFGNNHLRIATVLNNLGLVMDDMDNDMQAQKMLQRALSIRKKELGSENIRTALVMENLANLLKETGDYSTAHTYLKDVLEVRKRIQGADHPETAKTLIRMGYLLKSMGDRLAAREKFEDALAIFNKARGPRHADIASVLRSLGDLEIDLENYERARAYLEQSLDMYTALFGPKDPQVALGLNHLGAWYRINGDYRAARAYYEQSLQVNREVLGENHPRTIESLNSLGYFFQMTQDDDLARTFYEQALKIKEEQWGKDHPQTAHALIYAGRRMQELDDYNAAQNCFERALSIYRSHYGDDHPDTSLTLNYLGYLMSFIGDYRKGRQYLAHALTIDRRIWGNRHPQTALTLNYLGIMARMMGDDPAARVYWEEALAINRSILGPGQRNLTTGLNNLGFLLRRSDPTASKRYFQQELDIVKAMLEKENPKRPGTLLRVAKQYKKMRQYTSALPFYEQALAIRKAKLGPDHPRTASILNQIGYIYEAVDDWPRAVAYYQKALAIYDKVYGPENVITAHAMINVGQGLYIAGEKDSGKRHFERSLSVYRKIRGPDHPDTADRMITVGGFLREQADFQAALPYLERGLAVRERIFGSEHPDTAGCHLQLSHLFAASGDAERAWRHLSAGAITLARLIRRRLAANPEAGHLAMVQYQRYVFEALLNRAESYPDLAARKGHELASAIFAWKALSRQTLQARQEALVFNREEGTARLYEELKTVRQQLARVQLQGSGGRSGDQVHRNAETLRRRQDEIERQLADRVKGYASWRQHFMAGPDDIAEYLDRRSVLVDMVKYRQFHFDEPKDAWGPSRYAAVLLFPAERKGWLTDLVQAEMESRRLEKSLMIYFTAKWVPFSHKMEKEFLDSPEILDEINEKFITVKIDMDTQREIGERFGIVAMPSFVFVDPDGKVTQKIMGYQNSAKFIESIKKISKGKKARSTIRFVWMGEAESVEQAVQTWRKEAQNGPVDPVVEKNVRSLLWDPIVREFPENTDRLFIVPDGQVALLPFEAVRMSEGRFLVERFRVSYLSSGRDLIPSPIKPEGEPGPAVVVSSPDYNLLGDVSSHSGEKMLLATNRQRRSSEVGDQSLTFQSLPGFTREAEAVARVFRAGRPNQRLELLEGGMAREEQISALKRPQLLYFITHGFFFPDLKPLFLIAAQQEGPEKAESEEELTDERALKIVTKDASQKVFNASREDPRLRSGLALSGANRWSERASTGRSDGLLTALEVQNLDLWGTGLVVLSACETGLGEVKVGEGVMGLRRAFQQAGAETILASLWKVPDRETEWLMSRFFKFWLEGMPKSDALRRAQLSVIADLRKDRDPLRRLAPPILWAGFICHGRPK
ncbi:MAG: tetratricopeptide repeat protein [Deltaproteobacteria bacterium]|nr:tetratricopeptide repeat protein [Deltaproteobacteria bacterium]